MCLKNANVTDSSHIIMTRHRLASLKHIPYSIQLLQLIDKFGTRKLYCRCEFVCSFPCTQKKNMAQKFSINVSTFTSIYVMYYNTLLFTKEITTSHFIDI